MSCLARRREFVRCLTALPDVPPDACEHIHLELDTLDASALFSFERASSRWQHCLRLTHVSLHIANLEFPSQLARILFGMANTGRRTFTVHWFLDAEPIWKDDVATLVCRASDPQPRTAPPLWIYPTAYDGVLRLDPPILTPLTVPLAREIITFPSRFVTRIGYRKYTFSTANHECFGDGCMDDARTFANFQYAQGHPYWIFLDDTRVWMMWLACAKKQRIALLSSWPRGARAPDMTISLGTHVYPQAYVVRSNLHIMIHLGHIGFISRRINVCAWRTIDAPPHEKLDSLDTLANTWRQPFPLGATDRNLGVDILPPSRLLRALDSSTRVTTELFYPIQLPPRTDAYSPREKPSPTIRAIKRKYSDINLTLKS